MFTLGGWERSRQRIRLPHRMGSIQFLKFISDEFRFAQNEDDNFIGRSVSRNFRRWRHLHWASLLSRNVETIFSIKCGWILNLPLYLGWRWRTVELFQRRIWQMVRPRSSRKRWLFQHEKWTKHFHSIEKSTWFHSWICGHIRRRKHDGINRRN